MEAQLHKNTKIYVETLFPWREKSRDELRIISLYKIEITTLRDTTWVKKKKPSLFFFTHCSLPHYVFSLTLSIFLLSFACSLMQFFKTALVLTLWDFTSFLPPCLNGWMASLFNSSSFPSFLPFTLFTSSHNKCKSLTLTLLQPKSLSSVLIGRMVQEVVRFEQAQEVCKKRKVHDEMFFLFLITKSINVYVNGNRVGVLIYLLKRRWLRSSTA